MTTEYEILRSLEEALLAPEIRRSPERISDLLDEEFREFGSSGRVFSKSEIFAEMQHEADGYSSSLEEFRVLMLAPGVALVTYIASRHDEKAGSIRSLRSSVWTLKDERWQMSFHQGTRIASTEFS